MQPESSQTEQSASSDQPRTQTAEQYWNTVRGAAKNFPADSSPLVVAQQCVPSGKSSLAPAMLIAKRPFSTSPDWQRICEGLEGWGAYWCVLLMKAGLFDTEALAFNHWSNSLNIIRLAISRDTAKRDQLSQALKLPESLRMGNQDVSQNDLVNQCLENMEMLSALKQKCERNETQNEFPLAIVSADGILQGAATYTDQEAHLDVEKLMTAPWNLFQSTGIGKYAITQLAQRSKDLHHNGKLALYSQESARNFYKHLGFKVFAGSRLTLDEEDAEKLLAASK